MASLVTTTVTGTITVSSDGSFGGANETSATLFVRGGNADFWNSANSLLRINHDGTRANLQSFTGGAYDDLALNPDGGSVIIGGTSSFAKLDVRSSVSGKYLYMDDGSNAAWDLRGESATTSVIQTPGTGWSSWAAMDLRANYFKFKPNNIEIMRVISTGVGIGTNAPDSLLMVYKSGADSIIHVRGAAGGGDARVRINGYESSELYIDRNNVGRFAFRRTTGTDDLSLLKLNDDYSDNSTIMFWDYSSGNVGIGTNAPAQILHVQAATSIVHVQSSTSNANASIWFNSNVSGTQANRWEIGTNISRGASLEIFDRLNSASRLELTNTGLLGVGQAPTANFGTLQVYATGNHTNEQNAAFTIGDNATGGMRIYGGVNNSSNYSFIGSVESGTAYRPLVLQPNGSYACIGNVNTALSSGSNNSLQILTNSGWLQIAPQNSSFCHFMTDRGQFYFNKQVNVAGHVLPYSNNTYSSGLSTNRWTNVYSVNGDFSGCVGIGTDNPGGRLAIRTTANEKSLWIAPSGATTASVLHMECDSLTTGSGVYIHSNTSNNSSRKLVYINNDHTSATGATCLYINQDSTGAAISTNDANLYGVVGRLKIGYMGHSDYAGISHRDMGGTGNYALIQGPNGSTFLNAANNQVIYFRINNADVLKMDATSLYSVTNGAEDLGKSGNRWNNVYSEAGNFSGTVTGGTFSGSGASLTSLNAANLTGTVNVNRLGSSGTRSSSTFLRGDNQWATPSGGGGGDTVSITTSAADILSVSSGAISAVSIIKIS